MAKIKAETILHSRRPTVTTIALGIAGISFLATILQGSIQLLSSQNIFYFDFIYASTDLKVGLSWKEALFVQIWAFVGLISCFLALEPRNIARYTVIATSGVKLFAFLTFSDVVQLPIWRYILTILIAATPVVLLLMRPSNSYYGQYK